MYTTQNRSPPLPPLISDLLSTPELGFPSNFWEHFLGLIGRVTCARGGGRKGGGDV